MLVPGSRTCCEFIIDVLTYPGGDPCVAGVSLAGAPTEPGQHHDEGDDVEQRRHHRVHNLQPQERERKLYLIKKTYLKFFPVNWIEFFV